MKGIFVVALAAVVVAMAMATNAQSAPSESEFPPAEQGLVRMGGGGKARGVDKAYWLSTFRANQAQAQSYCRQQGLNLLVIRNNAKQTEVQEQYRDYWGTSAPEWVWLNAFKDTAAGSEFFYDDQNKLVFYSNFMNNFNNWANGNCIILLGPNGFNGQSQYKWMLSSCTTVGKFICEDN